MQKCNSLHAGSASAACILERAKRSAARKQTADKKKGAADEGGLAVVEQTDLKDMVQQKHVVGGPSGKSMMGWSDFKVKVGEFFVLMGVHHGYKDDDKH